MDKRTFLLPDLISTQRQSSPQAQDVPQFLSFNVVGMPPEPISMPPSYNESQWQFSASKVVQLQPFPFPMPPGFPLPLPCHYAELQNNIANLNAERKRLKQNLNDLTLSLDLHKQLLIQKEEQINNMKEKLRSKNKILSSILSSQHKKDFAIQRQRNQLYTLMDDLSMKDQIIAVKKNNIDYVIDKEPFTLHSGLAHPSHTMKVSVATMTTGLSRELFDEKRKRRDKNMHEIVDDLFIEDNSNATEDGIIEDENEETSLEEFEDEFGESDDDFDDTTILPK